MRRMHRCGHDRAMRTEADKSNIGGSVLCLVGTGTADDERGFEFARWLADAMDVRLTARPAPRGGAVEWPAGADHAAVIVAAARGSRLTSVRRPERSPQTAVKLGVPVVLVPSAGPATGSTSTNRELVCGVDRSRGARSAVLATSALARRLDAPMALVHVQQPLWPPTLSPMTGTPTPPVEAPASVREAGWELLDQLDEIVPERARLRLRSGLPARCIEEHAAARDAPLIVVGAPDHGPIASLLFHSTAWELARLATRPVMYVPEGFNPS